MATATEVDPMMETTKDRIVVYHLMAHDDDGFERDMIHDCPLAHLPGNWLFRITIEPLRTSLVIDYGLRLNPCAPLWSLQPLRTSLVASGPQKDQI